jgi:hypothetical protein
MKIKYIAYFFAVSFLSSCVFFRPKPSKLFERAKKNAPYDAIIVPGVPYFETQKDSVMKGRVMWANYLIQKGIAKNVIFSGAAVYSPYVEAKVFSLYAQALGTPKDKIFIEDKAQHSTENVYYSYCLAKKLAFKKLAVATDIFQSPQLMGFTNRKIKDRIDFIPFVVDTLKTLNGKSPVINPESAHVDNFKSIVETQSKWHRLRGTMGKNINFEKE